MMYQRMRDLPCAELPYEKCCTFGESSLSEAELLAVILRTGCNGIRVTDLAMQVLSLCEQHGGLGYLCQVPLNELMTIRGIGKIKAIQLKCLAEISKRIWKSTRKIKDKMQSPSDIASYFREEMRSLSVEETRLLFLDGRNHLSGEILLTIGTVNCSLVSTREIFKEALKFNAVSVILLHNHPSGDPTPSKEDIFITQKVKEAGMLMDIALLDHIIIGEEGFISLKEKGYI